jgi:hypothetical protein
MKLTENSPELQDFPVGGGLAFPERRKSPHDRRKNNTRRTLDERRCDSRLTPVKPKPIRTWLRSLFQARLGVDRRKKNDRRKYMDRRQQRSQSILTPEEIADLLS